MPSSTLPTPRTLLTNLFTTVPPPPTAPSPGPLPPTLKPHLLTLHILFPNELLPALDLLDRNLLTRFTIQSPLSSNEEIPQQPLPSGPLRPRQTPLYHVRSSQQQPRHYKPSENHSPPHYEVRPLSWNCSCPAFAFSAFPASSNESLAIPGGAATSWGEVGADVNDSEWHVGGLSRGEGMPMCKHLLACVMVERWREFRGGVEERRVSVEELAGWGAGWGG